MSHFPHQLKEDLEVLVKRARNLLVQKFDGKMLENFKANFC